MPLTKQQLGRLRREPVAPNRVKAARIMAGLTQVDLAAALGIGQPSLSDIERARYDSVSLETARKFATYFGCQIEDLFPARQAVAS